jgi:hypothetical protein
MAFDSLAAHLYELTGNSEPGKQDYGYDFLRSR